MGMGAGFGEEDESPHYSFVRNYGNEIERSQNEFRINSANANFRSHINANHKENNKKIKNKDIPKVLSIKFECFIKSDSIELEETNNNKYNISFIISQKGKAIIFIYLCAYEMIEDDRIKFFIHKEKGGEIVKFENEEGINQKIKKEINLSEFLSGRKSFIQDGSYYPIIIEAVNTEKISRNNLKESKYIIYLKIESEGKSLKLKTIKQLIEFNNVIYNINCVYGQSNLSADSKKECTVCLINNIDTVILPCYHYTLCYNCSLQIRSTTNLCPI